MNISNSYYSYGTSYPYGLSNAGNALSHSAQSEKSSASFANSLDQVTLSEEARNMSAQGAGGYVGQQSITQTYLNQMFGDPKELEEKTEEWKKRQLIGQGQQAGDSAAEDSQVKKDFTAYMDKALGRGAAAVSGGKSPEERIKELTAQIKSLQSRLSEITTNPSLPEATKTGQTDAINAKINALHAQISEIAKTLTESGQSQEG